MQVFTNEEILELIPSESLQNYLKKINWQFSEKDKDILSFRENIIALAQSYYIPDGKYQLIEKELFRPSFYGKRKIIRTFLSI